MNSEEIDQELRNLAEILLRLNKMIVKLDNSNKDQKYLEPLHDKKKYEKQINKALETLKKLISEKVKNNNNSFETGQCLYQGPSME